MAEYLIQGNTLTDIADAIREVLHTTTAYPPTEMATAIRNTMTESTSLVNYDVTFSSSSSLTTIVVIYSQWTDNGIQIITQDISETTTISILQNSSFTMMGVDGTYSLSGIETSENISDIRSIATGVYYSYCFSCNGNDTINLTY